MIYPESFESKVGFSRIREMLADYCTGASGREYVSEIGFSSRAGEVHTMLDETWEMQHLLNAAEPFYLDNSHDIRPAMVKIRVAGAYITTEELFTLRKHLESLRLVIAYFRKTGEMISPTLRSQAMNVKYYPAVVELTDRIIDKNGVIRETASPKLKEIRSELTALSARVTKRLQAVLKSARAEGVVDPDASVSVRNGRCVIPVNVYNKRKIAGLIHDQSASGKTVYIEPAEVVEINNDIVELEYGEKREIVRILTEASDRIRPYIDDIHDGAQYLGRLDFIRAKALLGNRLGSTRPVLRKEPGLRWTRAIHPLLYTAFEKLPDRVVVPLDIELEPGNRIIVISGPNAGGKSVCLKTTGLLQYMLQCGLTIPVGEGSESGLFGSIFIDIGDEQSIENDLSTYSSHLQSMKLFLRYAGEDSLILIDEFGAGTEPAIGGAIAEAILSELNRKGVFGVITTHYTNLKHFASNTPGIVNGAMMFDNHLMQPLFRLVTGKPGSSFAFEIARKIGLPESVLNSASEKAGKENVVYDKFLRDIARDRRYWEKKRESVRKHERRLEELEQNFESELKQINDKKKEIMAAARKEAENLLSGSNRIIENTIREIRESEAERERTREARRKLEEFREQVTGSEKKVETPALNRRAEKQKPVGKKRDSSSVRASADTPWKPATGTYVKMSESDGAGVVEDINDTVASVRFGNVIIRLPVEKLQPTSKAEFDRQHRHQTKPVLDWESTARKSGFSPQLDLRGMKTEEALPKVQEFLDRAWMISYPSVRILHGKGYGILRQQIRQYLSTLGYLRSFDDAPVEQGGSGITIVELDV
ncbi:MAG: endonuclease MutS2 [Bacteroidetes bacterium]|nr:endonuclease MutS2 [Bacteroidota bacterium]